MPICEDLALARAQYTLGNLDEWEPANGAGARQVLIRRCGRQSWSAAKSHEDHRESPPPKARKCAMP